MIDSVLYWILLLVGAVVYWVTSARWRPAILAVGSILYLLKLQWTSTLVMLVMSAAFFFVLARAPATQRRWVSVFLIGVALIYLGYFKYLPSLLGKPPVTDGVGSRVVPIGLSYFTFKLIHYVLEVSRGTVTSPSFPQFLSYVFLFPIFSGGPIERIDHFLPNQAQHWNISFATEGVTRIVHGLIKRFFIGEQLLRPLAMAVPEVIWRLPEMPVRSVWKFCLLTFLYSYVDFSGLSDIAIGSSRLFGIRIMENFNWPILANNIAEFWKRWHMTLAGWCQSYVYMPIIGLTRNPYLAVYGAFIVMGLWHAGSLHWIGWGAYHATGVALTLTWGRVRRKAGWGPLARGAMKYVCIALTILFVSGGSAFTAVWNVGRPYDSIRILAKMIAINLPR